MTRIILIALLLPASFSATAASFTPLGDLAGGTYFSRVTDISGNGTIVVGNSSTAAGTRAFIWTASTGMVEMAAANGITPTVANAISGDGTVIVGSSDTPLAWRWSSASGFEPLVPVAGETGTSARAASYDGSVVGGESLNSFPRAVIWTAPTSPDPLGIPIESSVYGVSADGLVAVGGAQRANVAFRWSEADGIIDLGDLPGGYTSAAAQATSGNGSIVVGTSSSAAGWAAFRWTADTGMLGLGDLAGGNFGSSASDITRSGDVIVGAGSDSRGQQAVLWTTAGVEAIFDLLVAQGVMLPEGWRLTSAKAISDDGLAIVGTGVNPDGFVEGWIAQLDPYIVPLPASIWLFISSLSALAGLRLRSIGRATAAASHR